ncbi:bifunctional 2-polyprenyl-6-hydroxyphenol methylase/3-demethylubiquinol 3-O-methyltransferase UbiG [Desulforhabdus sp. TSK]|uniref:class I SAM-dependent methyltransferase n=1 Tax=Desulforhabdus sp. TSK TaxID=2925014 RepID=UPI001FC8AFEE|nr:class I SAM-dependent methyltransferase [Desulforhabdus sp. TSK]
MMVIHENATKLLPDHLKKLWQSVEQERLTAAEFQDAQKRALAGYQATWEDALRLVGYGNLKLSLLSELGLYLGCEQLAEVELRCTRALAGVKGEWHGIVDPGNRHSVEQFYDESQAMIYELMWWHTLAEDNSPLAYVLALHFATLHGCHHYLDFGAGVGSGGILFAKNGLETALADISSTMLSFCQWRFELRKLSACFIDLKSDNLPDNTFDIVTAMDVFEHLVDPVETVDVIWQAMKPGGYLFGRFHSEPDEDRPHHIIQDFAPTLRRLEELGCVEVWKDEWLWGHQVFQKS